MMMKLSKKTIYCAIAASVVAVCIMVFVGVFALGPQRKAIRAVDDRIEEVEHALVSLKTNGYSSEVIALKQELSSAQKNLSRYVVSPEQASDLTVDIGKIAKQAGVQDLHSTNRMQGSYGPINECRHIREGRIQIKFKSSFSQFARFINLLEYNQPVIFVDYFNIKRSTSNNNRHDVDMVLTFFYGQDSLADVMDAGISSDSSDFGLVSGTGSVVN